MWMPIKASKWTEQENLWNLGSLFHWFYGIQNFLRKYRTRHFLSWAPVPYSPCLPCKLSILLSCFGLCVAWPNLLHLLPLLQSYCCSQTQYGSFFVFFLKQFVHVSWKNRPKQKYFRTLTRKKAFVFLVTISWVLSMFHLYCTSCPQSDFQAVSS